MPNYDFKCKQCNKVIEALTSMNVNEISCDCGGVAEKQISAPGVIFKGSGWPTADSKPMPGSIHDKEAYS